ncbi:MAG TPA: hypothetical protein VJH92_03185 [Candidatus Nanoarchaeia archaeon]|nr:hypothetical protein [Candidatus Nanoarchaeia archaeon]
MNDDIGKGLEDFQGNYLGKVTNLYGPNRILFDNVMTLHKDLLTNYKIVKPQKN